MIVNPRSDCNKHIIKREHYARKNGEWKPKKKFNTKEEALEYIKINNIKKYTVYMCNVCGKWHIGGRKLKYEEIK